MSDVAPDIAIANFRAPSADLDRDLAAITQKVAATSAAAAGVAPVPFRVQGAGLPAFARASGAPTYGAGISPGVGLAPIPLATAPLPTMPMGAAASPGASPQVYGFAPPAQVYGANVIPLAALPGVGRAPAAYGVNYGGFQGPLLPGGLQTSAGQYNAIRDSVLGDNEIPQGFLRPPGVGRRPSGLGGGGSDTLALAGNVYAASRIAHVAARGLDAFGSFEAGQRAAARGDIEGSIRGDEAIKRAAEGLPLGTGTLGVSIRENVLDRFGIPSVGDVASQGLGAFKNLGKDQRGLVEQTAADAVRINKQADYAKVRADRLTAGRELADSLEGGVDRSDDESRLRAIAIRQRAVDQAFNGSSDPTVKARAQQAINDQRADAQIAGDRASGQRLGEAGVLGARLRGDTDAATRGETELSITAGREAARRESGQVGVQQYEAIATARRGIGEQEIGNRRTAETGDSVRVVQASSDRIREIRLRTANEADKAELDAFRASWDQRIAIAREAVQTTTDVTTKALREREAAALESERTVAEQAFEIRKRYETNSAVASIQSDAEVARLRAAGNTDAADEAARQGVQRREVGGLAASGADRAVVDATTRRQVADDAEVAAERGRRLVRRQRQVVEGNLQLQGRSGEAEALRIQRETRERLVKAAGNPEDQATILREASLEAKETNQRILSRGPPRGEIVTDPSLTNFSRGSASDRQSQALIQLNKQILEQLTKLVNKKPPAAVLGP